MFLAIFHPYKCPFNKDIDIKSYLQFLLFYKNGTKKTLLIIYYVFILETVNPCIPMNYLLLIITFLLLVNDKSNSN